MNQGMMSAIFFSFCICNLAYVDAHVYIYVYIYIWTMKNFFRVLQERFYMGPQKFPKAPLKKKKTNKKQPWQRTASQAATAKMQHNEKIIA